MLRKDLLSFLVLFFIISCNSSLSQVKGPEKPIVEAPKKVDINTAISKLSQQISSTMLEQNKRKVAVMNFPLLTGEMTELGLYLADKLTNSLFQYRDKFEVVERARLESVLKEMELGATGIIDDKTAQSIGKVIGADAIVIGTITNLGKEVDVNARMLGTEKAVVLAVASSLLEKDDTIIRLVGNIRMAQAVGAKPRKQKTEVTTSPPEEEKPEEEAASPSQPLPILETESYQMSIISVKKSGTTLTMVMIFENLTANIISLGMNGCSDQYESFPHLLDDRGELWTIKGADTAQIFGCNRSPVKLAPGAKRRTTVDFATKESITGTIFTFVLYETSPKSRDHTFHKIKAEQK